MYGAIVDHLLATGHAGLTAHLARPEVMELEQVVDPQEAHSRDIQWLKEADAIVAEVSTLSHGVGYEIAYALALGKPVLALHREGASVSKMITGNREPALRPATYRDAGEAVRQFLERLRQ